MAFVHISDALREQKRLHEIRQHFIKVPAILHVLLRRKVLHVRLYPSRYALSDIVHSKYAMTTEDFAYHDFVDVHLPVFYRPSKHNRSGFKQ